MIAKVSGLDPAGIKNNPKMTSKSAKATCQNADYQNESSPFGIQETRSGLDLSLKVLIGAFFMALGYCIFMGLKNTFAHAK